VAVSLCAYACSNVKTPNKTYCQTTQELINLVDSNAELKSLLTKAIAKGVEINPDTTTNPAQTLEEYYDFIEWSCTAMPWSVLKSPEGTSLYDQIDQSLDYFYFINDIPLRNLTAKVYTTTRCNTPSHTAHGSLTIASHGANISQLQILGKTNTIRPYWPMSRSD